MKEREKKKKGSPIPKTNTAVNYYIDPVYSANGLYGLENESENESEPDGETKKSEIDEPIESWGWVNNVD